MYARSVLAILERFPGYTLRTLREEDSELLRLLAIESLGAEPVTEMMPGE
jgi:hypothetical protein